MVIKVDTLCTFVLFAVALAATAAIRSQLLLSPNGGV
jgi:hypothetical protein